MKKSLLFAVIFILLFNIAIAEDYSVFSSKSDIFTCEQNPDYLDVLTIVNQGLVSHAYDITYEGSAGYFSYAVPNKFVLLPGESQVAYVYSQSPINTLGEFDLITKVSSDDNIVKYLNQKVNVDKCNNIKASSEFGMIKTCPARTVTIPIKLENSGVYNEEYSLSVDTKLDTIATFSANNFVLLPNQKMEVYLMVELSSFQYGVYDYDVVIDAKLSGLISRLPVVLDILPCYDYSLDVFDVYESCKRIDSNVTFKIKNYAEADNYFNIKIEGPDWVKLSDKKVFVKAGEFANVNLLVNPAIDEAIGDVSVFVSSEYGNLKSNKSFKIIPAHCYDLDIDVLDKVVTCSCEKETYSITVKNKGTKRDNFDISLSSSRDSVIDNWNKSVIINPGNEVTFDMDIETPCGSSGKYDIDTKVVSKTSDLRYSGFTHVDIVSAKECRESQFSLDLDTYNYSSNVSNTINIKNIGYKKATYLVKGYPVSQVSLGSKSVTLKPGASFAIPVKYSIDEAGKYEFAFKASTDNNQSYIEYFSIAFTEPFNLMNFLLRLGIFLFVLIFVLILIFFVANYRGRTKDELHEGVNSTTKENAIKRKIAEEEKKKQEEKERIEKEELEKLIAEKERIKAEELEKERLENERLERERLEKEETERLAKENAEKLAKEKAAKIKADKELKKSLNKKSDKNIDLAKNSDEDKDYQMKPFFKWMLLLLLLLLLVFGVYYGYNKYMAVGGNNTIYNNTELNDSVLNNSLINNPDIVVLNDSLLVDSDVVLEEVRSDSAYDKLKGYVDDYLAENKTVVNEDREQFESEDVVLQKENISESDSLFSRLKNSLSSFGKNVWSYVLLGMVYVKAFFSEYMYYILIGIVLLVLIILLVDRDYDKKDKKGKSNTEEDELGYDTIESDNIAMKEDSKKSTQENIEKDEANVKDYDIETKKSGGFLNRLFSKDLKEEPEVRETKMKSKISNFFFEVERESSEEPSSLPKEDSVKKTDSSDVLNKEIVKDGKKAENIEKTPKDVEDIKDVSVVASDVSVVKDNESLKDDVSKTEKKKTKGVFRKVMEFFFDIDDNESDKKEENVSSDLDAKKNISEDDDFEKSTKESVSKENDKSAKKVVVKKAAKKASAKKVNKKTVAKKATPKKVVTKKAVVKKSVVKKSVAKKAVIKKTVVKKSVAKKAIIKKAVAKKSAKKTSAKKVTSKKSPTNKNAKKKSVDSGVKKNKSDVSKKNISDSKNKVNPLLPEAWSKVTKYKKNK